MIADWLAPHAAADYVQALRKIEYIANVCLVLELDRSLSSTYWLNVNDPGFPFVGVIEHTNFEPTSTYGGRHIVYLSKYLPESDALYQMSKDEFRDFCIKHLQRMFPEFQSSWILQSHVWRATHSQPIVAKHYSQLIPQVESPVQGFYICTMAQIYPEDRGTNYAVREGRKVGQMLAAKLGA
jgi:protoporphyrinogen oxidase